MNAKKRVLCLALGTVDKQIVRAQHELLQLQHALQQDEQRMDHLYHYKNEYETKEVRCLFSGIEKSVYQNFETLIHNLGTAIGQQKKQVHFAENKYQQHQQRCQAMHIRQLALKKLLAKMEQDLRNKDDRRQMKETEESLQTLRSTAI